MESYYLLQRQHSRSPTSHSRVPFPLAAAARFGKNFVCSTVQVFAFRCNNDRESTKMKRKQNDKTETSKGGVNGPHWLPSGSTTVPAWNSLIIVHPCWVDHLLKIHVLNLRYARTGCAKNAKMWKVMAFPMYGVSCLTTFSSVHNSNQILNIASAFSHAVAFFEQCNMCKAQR